MAANQGAELCPQARALNPAHRQSPPLSRDWAGHHASSTSTAAAAAWRPLCSRAAAAGGAKRSPPPFPSEGRGGYGWRAGTRLLRTRSEATSGLKVPLLPPPPRSDAPACLCLCCSVTGASIGRRRAAVVARGASSGSGSSSARPSWRKKAERDAIQGISKERVGGGARQGPAVTWSLFSSLPPPVVAGAMSSPGRGSCEGAPCPAAAERGCD